MLPHQPTLHHYMTKGLFIAVPFTQYITSGYQEKNYKAYQKAKTQFEEVEQESEVDVAGMFVR